MNHLPVSSVHIRDLVASLVVLDGLLPEIDALGAALAVRLLSGARLLAAGNGGSAAHAQHLAAELVGRFERDRKPLSALALADGGCVVSALANDYGAEAAYARQVVAHGRPGDVLLCISTSGCSPNLLAAARAARELRLDVWSFTGALPNPLAAGSDRCVAVPASRAAIVQEVHLVALHLLCETFEREIELVLGAPTR